MEIILKLTSQDETEEVMTLLKENARLLELLHDGNVIEILELLLENPHVEEALREQRGSKKGK